jgi:hypothetical protein
MESTLDRKDGPLDVFFIDIACLNRWLLPLSGGKAGYYRMLNRVAFL